MNCKECNHKLKFVGGVWNCNGCGKPTDNTYLGTDAPDNQVLSSLEHVQRQGRIVHGDNYTEEHQGMVAQQRKRLAELDSQIEEMKWKCTPTS